MPGLPLNIATSAVAIAERFRKLYRILYYSFMKDDFVHQKDFNLYAKQMNARLKVMEANMKAGDAAVAAGAATVTAALGIKIALPHTSTVPGNPTIPNPAQIIPTPPAPPAPGPTTPDVTPKTTFLEQKGTQLLAEGPAQAPLGDGVSIKANEASITATESVVQLS